MGQPSGFRTYQNGIILMLFFTWGFVFMERLSVVYMFPFIGKDLHFTNTEFGLIVSTLSITWAISGWIFSSMSDLVGSHKKILVPATIAFSIFSFLTGIARSFTTMLLYRGLMGVAEGPVLPTAQAATSVESSPNRRGFNAGFVQSAAQLIGAFATPLIVTAIAVHSSWHMAFYVVGVPGLIMSVILWKFMKDKKMAPAASTDLNTHKKITSAEYKKVFLERNVWVCVIISAFFMTWLFAFTTFAPTYFTSIGYTAEQMGVIMSGVGLGAFVWTVLIPMISDKWGRKPTLIFFSVLSALSPILLVTIHASVPVMFILGMLTTAGNGVFPLFMVLIPSESLSLGVAASAISLTQLVGELIGGTVAPTIAGMAADALGLSAPLWIAAGGCIVCAIVGFALKETAPVKLKQRVPVASVATPPQGR